MRAADGNSGHTGGEREIEGGGDGGGGFSIKFHIKISFREQSVG